MPTITLSNKGQLIDTDDDSLVKPLSPFKKTTLDQVVGCLTYQGKTKSLEEMEEALRRGAENAAARGCD